MIVDEFLVGTEEYTGFISGEVLMQILNDAKTTGINYFGSDMFYYSDGCLRTDTCTGGISWKLWS